jgi:hypothetical protein
MSEIPVHFRPRRLADWINPTGAKKVHSLVDKVYKRKNLEMAWEKVKANRGSGGVDGQTLETFEAQLEQQLERLHRELRENTYQPLPVRQHRIPKQGVCQFLCVNDHGSVVGVEVEVGVVFGDGVAGEGGISPSLASPRRKELWCIMPTCPAWACARATGW